ncbi:MAG: hypothetical protein JNK31_02220, partial [Candidatus Competibacter sp.]|nr:hypothetical protein [Candidatus Competibacter sp.]
MNEAGFGSESAGPPPAVEGPQSNRNPLAKSVERARRVEGKRWRVEQRRSPLKTALYMLGLLMIVFSATMLPPMAVAWWYDGPSVVLPFAHAMGAMLVLGLIFWLPVHRYKVDLRNRDGFAVVVLFWVGLSVIGALPFMLSANPHVRLVDAVFETVS